MLAGPRSVSYSQASYNNSSPNAEKNVSYLEFKYLYFKIQKLVNQKVVLSLKYDQLKTPEIHSQITKPLTTSIIEVSNQTALSKKFNSHSSGGAYTIASSGTISQSTVFILLLLRYEYLIQSENNLISFELLTTKANICEILAIRMLREYKSNNRIHLLFIYPLGDQFNTLELSVLSKSKKFLSQPIITQIMEKIYNGDITIRDSGRCNSDNESLLNQNVMNYRFQKISMNLVKTRSESVPKYQSLVINIKLIVFTILYFIIILKHKQQLAQDSWWRLWVNVVELLFWCITLNMNFEMIIKIKNIRFKFLRKIIWTYIDLVLLVLLDFVFLLKLYLLVFNSGSKQVKEVFHNFFSIISIILLPRILSIFNNYEFFNMIILSCKRMLWKMIGLFCLFISLISGFYISFISLSINQTSSSIMFSMLKVFFGYTPSIWDNWDNYNTLGKFTQMGYLFLIQFVIATILAIVLSEVFHKISATNKEEFNYFKTTNIIIYQQTSKIFRDLNYNTLKSAQTQNGLSQGTSSNPDNNMIHLVTMFVVISVHKIMDLFKLPIIIAIFIYELAISELYKRGKGSNNTTELKHFTFLNKDRDYYGDSDMVIDDDYVSKTRKSSIIPDFANNINSPFIGAFGSSGARKMSMSNNLAPVPSISTIGNFKSASTDSLFIDEMLHRRYGQQTEGGGGGGITDTIRTNSDIKRTRSRTYKELRNENEIIQKLNQIETLFSEVVNKDKEKEPVRPEDPVSQVDNQLPPQEYIPSSNFESSSFRPVDFQSSYSVSESAALNDAESVTSIESISDNEEHYV